MPHGKLPPDRRFKGGNPVDTDAAVNPEESPKDGTYPCGLWLAWNVMVDGPWRSWTKTKMFPLRIFAKRIGLLLRTPQ